MKRIIQLGALILFLALIALGKVQLWMGIFLGSLILSTYFGRFYCGYICPINTVMEGVDQRAEKSKRVRRETPSLFKSSVPRYLLLVVFLAMVAFIFKTGKKLPVLPALFVIGILLTIVYKPDFWHRYLCPYGSLLSIFSRFNKRTYQVIDQDCIKCGICVRVCPADAFNWAGREEYPEIIKNECLLCGKCASQCPTETIKK